MLTTQIQSTDSNDEDSNDEGVEEFDEQVEEHDFDVYDFDKFNAFESQETRAKQERDMEEMMEKEVMEDKMSMHNKMKEALDWTKPYTSDGLLSRLQKCEKTGFIINEKGEYLLMPYELPYHFNIELVPIPFVLLNSLKVDSQKELFDKQLYRFISREQFEGLLFASPNQYKEVIDFELRLHWLSYKVIIDKERNIINVVKWNWSDLNYFKANQKHPFIYSPHIITIQGIRKRLMALKNILERNNNRLINSIRKDENLIDYYINLEFMYSEDKSMAKNKSSLLKSKLESKYTFLHNIIMRNKTDIDIQSERLNKMYERYKVPSDSKSGGNKKTKKNKRRHRKKSSRYNKKY